MNVFNIIKKKNKKAESDIVDIRRRVANLSSRVDAMDEKLNGALRRNCKVGLPECVDTCCISCPRI